MTELHVENTSEHDTRLRVLLDTSRGLNPFEDRRAVLEEIVRGAVATVPGAEHAGVSLRHPDGRIETLASTDDLVALIDAAQAELHEGPCIEAIDADAVVSVPDMAAENDRWPRFTARALPTGLSATLSFRLFTRRGTLGALNLHALTPHAFTAEDHQLGELFAGYAALALAGADRAEHLNHALESRDVIGQAKGILMARHHIDADQAFAMLVRASQDTNIKLHDVARWLATDAATGEHEQTGRRHDRGPAVRRTGESSG